MEDSGAGDTSCQLNDFIALRLYPVSVTTVKRGKDLAFGIITCLPLKPTPSAEEPAAAIALCMRSSVHHRPASLLLVL